MSKKIVLIEDNDEVRENIQEILELADYEVIAGENGKIGVDLVKKHSPDLVLCDIMMPELDGYGVLHMLSRNAETSKIPFIFLTAKSENEDFRKGMNMGADDYLTKPFDDVQLLNAVEKRLDRISRFAQDFDGSHEGLNNFVQEAGVQDLEALTQSSRIKKYNKKDNVYFEGDYPGFLYFVKSGKLKTSKMNEDGKDFVTGLYKEGDFLGYMALIKDHSYEEAAIALEPTELVLIPREEFIQLLNGSKEVSMKFIKMLAGSISEKQEELLNLAYDSVRKRVADALLKLADTYKEENGDNFTMSISRDDLAAIVGTATESVIRTLSEFKADGYISIKGSNITIIEESELRNFRF
ncbi:response regulator [Paracrocinitomix mangrovi]|uniref:response regulator n=1 Tax=Paracrocinitomix mangrovi TaxID=2862509 RepID=UPI001C8E849B|nr:response regulator [Paracrocinitomix mangrovi]UKN01483.1 response regulator [Paracrocinitomix mangrovi]